MKKKSLLISYFSMLLFFGLLMYSIIEKGRGLEKSRNFQLPGAPAGMQENIRRFQEAVQLNLRQGLPVLLLQIIIIIIAARLCGWLFRRIGQPAVIGEIAAGIALGPSLLGLVAPGFEGFLFPPSSLGNLHFLSQIGLILFMFVIGMELDMQVIRKQAMGALLISHASIVIPFTMGLALSFFLYERFASTQTPFLSFACFMGIAMSITAFPVLARILQERNLTRSRLGNMALTAAAMGDVSGWCVLAFLIAAIRAGSSVSALFTVWLVIVYVFGMLFIVRPVLKKVHQHTQQQGIGKSIIALLLMILLLSAFLTETIGIHALFGAFMAGLIMPPDMNFRRIVTEKIEDLSVVLLLPLFFVITGLRTHIDFSVGNAFWIPFGWILLVAVAGKFGGTALAARWVGQSWEDSLSLGALMNARGLMELIVLNIGYDLGIISSQVFSMLVLMALITTFMTSPALALMGRIFGKSGKT